MRKLLRIIIVTSALISAVASIVLGFIYMEDVLAYFKKAKNALIGNED